MKVIALICARGGSKGLPRKNVKLLAGKPLVCWAVEQALSVPDVERAIVSTDCAEIAAHAQQAGAEVPFTRPSELADDDSPEWLVWRHTLRHLLDTEYSLPDALLVVPPTAPLRTTADLQRCLAEYETERPDVVITVSEPHRSPYFNMVKADAKGNSQIVISEGTTWHRRQDVPEVFDVTTVGYVANPRHVLHRDSMFSGRVRHVVVPRAHAIDIDTGLDFEMAEFLIRRKADTDST